MNPSQASGDVNQSPAVDAPELLLSELRQRPGLANLRFSAPPQPLSGGFWAEIFVLHLDDASQQLPAQVVARIAPDSVLAAWETAVQAGAANQGFPTPDVHMHGGPDGAVGKAWTLMDLAAGKPLLAGLSGVSALIRLPQLARQLPDQLARITAQLHALDPWPIEQELIATTNRPVGIDGFLAHLSDRAHALGDDRLLAVAALLARTQPEPLRQVLCHGDLHPFNVLVDDGELTLLDWTASQITDPAYDLGFTSLLLSMAPLEAPGLVKPTIAAAARWVSRRFLHRYEVHAGVTIDQQRLRWNTTLHATRILTEVAGWDAAGTTSTNPGHPFNAIAPQIRHLVDQALVN